MFIVTLLIIEICLYITQAHTGFHFGHGATSPNNQDTPNETHW